MQQYLPGLSEREKEVAQNILNIENFYHLKDHRKLISIIINKKQSQELFEQKKIILSDVFQNKNNNGLDYIKKIQLFAQKYTFQKLTQKFKKPKSFRINQLIDTLKKKMETSIIENDQIRKLIWMLASGALFSMKHSKGLFKVLLQYPNYPDYYSKAINVDTKRTILNQQSNQNDLKDLLIAFSRRNPYIGYCQGLNFIANFLLQMKFTVQQAFWILSDVMQTVIPMDYFTNMVGVVCDQQIFLQILSIIKPKIKKKFNQVGLDGSILSIQWFVCLFTAIIPKHLSKIIWDRLLIQGTQALIKAGLIFLSYFQKQILQTTQFYEIIVLVQNRIKNISISQQQFNKQFNKYYINQQGLDIARDLYRQLYLKKKIQQKIQQDNCAISKNNQINYNQCNINWPICINVLQESKKNMKDIQIWIYRQQTPPVINHNYLDFVGKKQKNYNNQKNDKNGLKIAPTKSLEISEQVIGRMQHTCQHSKQQRKVSPQKKKKSNKRPLSIIEEQTDREDKNRKRLNLQKLSKLSEFSQAINVQTDLQQSVQRTQTFLFLKQFRINHKEISEIRNY